MYKQATMFVEGFKEGLRYAGSVAERTVGANAYKRWRRFLGPHPELSIKDPLYTIGCYLEPSGISGFQIALPGVTELIPRLVTERPDGILSFYRIATPLVAIDVATWQLALIGNDLWEIVTLKLATNAATHVALDLAGEAVKRIKSFRPSATTLAV